MNGTKITGSVLLITEICIDFNNIPISFLENLLMYLKTCSLLLQHDILSVHTANNSVDFWESVYGAWLMSSECSLIFAWSKAMISICTSTCGACWRTKCRVTILSLQTTCQNRSGSNAFNLTNKSWTWSESHVRCVACLQEGLNLFWTPNTNCNKVNYILWTPIHTTMEKWRKLCSLPPWESIWEARKAVVG